MTVAPGYFDVFQIPIVRGRAFTDRDTLQGQPVVMINEAMARQYWPDGDPLSARLVIGRGVMREFSTESDSEAPGSILTLTDKLCLPLDTGGEVSCRVDDRVVLNAKRWMYAVPAYAGKVDLYRSYLVNHEVGHFLGHGHSTCPKAKTPAPVMMQQTKGLDGCLPNAWPTIKAT